MNQRGSSRKSPESLRRTMLMVIVALAWASSAAGWAVLESTGRSSEALRLIFGLNVVFHPTLLFLSWQRLVRQRTIEIACLLFAAGVCAFALVLRLYFPIWGSTIDTGPLYIWIPVIYVFAFTAAGHKTSLKISLAIYAAFAAICAPFLFLHIDAPIGNFTVQLLLVSAIMIAALYFFSSYQHAFQIAQLTMDQLARLANTDDLTQLANRRRMAEIIESELVRFRRYGHVFSVVLLDIDHFKDINDRHGHATGDRVLIALTARTTEVLRDVDTLGRWGGEEFLVILPETGYDNALAKAQELCTHVAALPLADGHAVTISCGVTGVRAEDDADRVLRRADEAMYAAKRGGRNRAEGM